MNQVNAKKAVLCRMVIGNHICPYGLKARDLLRRKGYKVQDNWLTTRDKSTNVN